MLIKWSTCVVPRKAKELNSKRAKRQTQYKSDSQERWLWWLKLTALTGEMPEMEGTACLKPVSHFIAPRKVLSWKWNLLLLWFLIRIIQIVIMIPQSQNSKTRHSYNYMHTQPQNKAKWQKQLKHQRRIQSFGDMGLSWKKEMIAEHAHECIKCY